MSWRLLLQLTFVPALGTSFACTSSTSPPYVPTDTTTVSWKQVWSDEFDGPAGTAPDATKWNYDLSDGCTSGIFSFFLVPK